VRCSRCKHAFFVLPPAETPADAVDQAVGAALHDDPTPGITEDLPEETTIPETPIAAESHESPETAADAPAVEDDESDWQFNGELPADPGDSSPDLHAVRSPGETPPSESFDPSADEPEESLALAAERRDPVPAAASRAVSAPAQASSPRTGDLGSPVDWDFVDRGAGRPAAAAAALPPRTIYVAPAAPAAAAKPAREIPIALQRAGAAAGWLATAALCAIALSRGLAPVAPVSTAWRAPAPGLALEDVRGRWVDSVPLGRLYVVSGRVHNTAATASALPPLVLELRDASGQAVGAPIPLRGAAPPGSLREADASSLAAFGSDPAGGLAPGVTWEFEAAAWPLPDEAARFAIRPSS
jgi:hypothetical protein